MSDKLKKNLLSSSALIIYFITILSALIIYKQPSFLSYGTLITLSRAMLVTVIFALGQMIVIIAGGIDVSFPAIANFALYGAMKLSLVFHIDSVFLLLLFAIVVGLFFGAINAYLVAYKKVPPLIATLGLSSVVHGATLAFLGTEEYSILPASLAKLSRSSLLTHTTASGITYSLSTLVLVPIILLVVVNFVLKKTKFGRSLYVVGGSKVAAATSGFRVKRIISFTYLFSGLMASIGGFIYMILMRNANPQVLMGSEMIVIAAVVMGGTRITGGHGTVFGTFLGILLITLVQNNLIMVGVPAHFQTFVIGLIIILGTTATSLRSKFNKEKRGGI